MHYLIMSEVADERRNSLLREAEAMRLARIAASIAPHHRSRSTRVASMPFVTVRAWLARGYL